MVLGGDRLFVRGILMLLSVPAIVVLLAILLMHPPFYRALGIYPLPSIAVMVLLLYPTVVYVQWLYDRVHYSDLDVLDMVVVPEAPAGIVDSLKTGTRGTNRLVNVEIILCLGKKSSAKRPIDQTTVVKLVQRKGVKLTHTRIIQYLRQLEELHIVRSEKGYKRNYYLTESGKWCHEAAKKCFPRRQFWFIIRHYLGRRKVPPFPKNQRSQPGQ